MPTAPEKPTGFSVESGNLKVTLTWNDPGNDTISKWQYKYKTTGDYGSWIDIPGSTAGTTRHIVSMPVNDTVHTFRIRAVNDIGEGAESDEASATPEARAPEEPSGLIALTGDAQITLEWTDPSDASILKWQYAYRTAGNYGDWADIPGSGAATTRHTIGELVNGTTYTIKIRAVNDVGDGPESDGVSATPLSVPAKPAGFAVTAGDALAVLEWDNPLNPTITGWEYSYRTTGSYSGWTGIPGSDAATTAHTVPDLENGVEHTFRLRAVNASGPGAESGGMAATPRPVPAKPAGLQAEAGNTQARLSWTDPGNDSISGWQYSLKTTGDYGAWTNIPGSGPSTVRYTVTGLANNVLHAFRIRAVNGSGAGTESDEASATPREGLPGKPTGFEAEAGDGEVVLTWDDPDDSSIQGWQYRSGEASGDYSRHPVNIPGSGAKTVRHVVTGLENGKTYFFILRATNAANGKWSDERSAAPRSLRPAAPTGLKAAPGDASVALRWDDPGDATITGWQYAVKTMAGFGAWMDISGSDAATTAYTATGLDNGEKHVFKLRAVNGHGAGAESAEVSATPVPVPVKPAGFEAAPRDGKVALTWNDPGDATITGWQYAVKTTGAYGPWTGIAGSGAETTAHTVSPLDNGTPYAFKLRAVNASGNGAESDEATATPLAVPAKPTGFTATAGDGEVSLTWTDPGNSSIIGWEYSIGEAGVYRDWTGITGSGASTMSYTVPDLDNGAPYAFRVRAVNPSGNGAESDEATATPLAVPAKPAGFTATAGDGQVSLQWADPMDATITGWQYAVETADGFGPWTGIPDSDAETAAYTVAPLDNGTPYAFKVRAVNLSGNGAESDEATATPIPVPAKPAGFTATVGDGQVSLSWTDPGNSSIVSWEYSIGEAGVYRDWTGIPASGASTTSYTVPGLDNGTPYTFKVRAVNPSGNGAESDEATATPLAVPAKPADLTATAGDGEITLSWTDPGNSSIIGWEYSIGEAGVYRDWTGIPGSGASTMSYTVPGLDNGTPYAFKVRAVNASGNGTESDEATATPLAVPAKPAGFAATAGAGEVVLSWDDPDDPTITGWEYNQRRAGGEFEVDWTLILGSGAATTSYRVTGLETGATYGFKVRAVAGGLAGAESDEETVTVTLPPVPAKPADLTATAGDREVTLTWDDPGDPSISGWQYRYGPAGEFGDWTGIPDSDAGTTGYTVTGLKYGASYVFRVRALNAGGNGKQSEDATATSLPAMPTGFTATAGDGKVLLEWDDPGDPSVTHWEYRQRQADEPFGNDWTVLPQDATPTRFTVPGLEIGASYAFKLRAVNASGAGAETDEVAATLLQVPAKPEEFTVIPGDGLAALRWQSPENPAAGWQYRHRTEGGEFGDWTDMPQTADDDGFTGYTVTGLENGVTYFFQVRAVGASGAGPPSETARASLEPALERPTGLRATPGYGQVVLTWEAARDPNVRWQYACWINGEDMCNPRIDDSPMENIPNPCRKLPWIDIPGSSAATVRHTVPGLASGIAHTFQIRTAVGDKCSDESNVAYATPKAAATPAERTTVKAVLAGLAGHVAVGANAVIGARFSAGPAQSSVVLAGREVPLFARGGEERMRVPPGGAPKATVRGISGRELLQDSSFQVALGPPGGEGFPQWSLWHRGDLTRFEGSAGAGSRYGGRLLSAWYGVDMRWDGRWLAGAALARSKAEVDYAGGGGSGLLRTVLDSVHPYLLRQFEEGGTAWVTVGSGRGTIGNETAGRDIETADAELATASTGFRAPLPAFRGLKLSASGAAGFARFEADGDAQTAIGSLSASTNRQSLGAEAALEDGDTAYRASLSLRRDGGDGANGIGLELAKGVEAALPSLSGHAAVRTRWLVWNSNGEYREFGVAAAVRRPAGPDGRGLSWSLSVAQGTADGAAGGPESFWREDAPERGGGEDAFSLDLSAGWGLVSRGSTFTPRAAFGLAGTNDRRLALGLDIGPLSGPRLKLGAERRIPHAGSPESRITAAVQFRF